MTDTVVKLPPRLGIGNWERTEAIVDAWVNGPRSDYLDQELRVAVETADHALRYIIEESTVMLRRLHAGRTTTTWGAGLDQRIRELREAMGRLHGLADATRHARYLAKRDENDRAKALAAIHRPVAGKKRSVCLTCRDLRGSLVSWPCPTMQALSVEDRT